MNDSELQFESARDFVSEEFESLLGIKKNYFRSYVEAPHYMVYSETTNRGSQPYSIFLHGEVSGDPQSGFLSPMYIKIDVHISVLMQQCNDVNYPLEKVAEKWQAPPDGYLKWDHIKRYGAQTAGNYQYKLNFGGNIKYVTFGVGFGFKPNTTVDYREKNDITYNGEYRRLVQLQTQYDYNKPHSFSAQIRLLLNNELANMYSSGVVVGDTLCKIKAFRVRAVFKFVAYHNKTYTHTLGNGGYDDYPELLLLPGSARIIHSRRLVKESLQAQPSPVTPPNNTPSIRYVGNNNTKEIHDIENITEGCNFDRITDEHKEYFDSVEEIENAMRERGYNGCRWCLSKYDTG
jgi:hypothetical protein